jgi:hypothetical protein
MSIARLILSHSDAEIHMLAQTALLGEHTSEFEFCFRTPRIELNGPAQQLFRVSECARARQFNCFLYELARIFRLFLGVGRDRE